MSGAPAGCVQVGGSGKDAGRPQHASRRPGGGGDALTAPSRPRLPAHPQPGEPQQDPLRQRPQLPSQGMGQGSAPRPQGTPWGSHGQPSPNSHPSGAALPQPPCLLSAPQAHSTVRSDSPPCAGSVTASSPGLPDPAHATGSQAPGRDLRRHSLPPRSSSPVAGSYRCPWDSGGTSNRWDVALRCSVPKQAAWIPWQSRVQPHSPLPSQAALQGRGSVHPAPGVWKRLGPQPPCCPRDRATHTKTSTTPPPGSATTLVATSQQGDSPFVWPQGWRSPRDTPLMLQQGQLHCLVLLGQDKGS